MMLYFLKHLHACNTYVFVCNFFSFCLALGTITYMVIHILGKYFKIGWDLQLNEYMSEINFEFNYEYTLTI